MAAAFSATKGPPARTPCQHGDLGLRQPADRAEHFLHGGGRGLRHHPALVVLRRFALPFGTFRLGGFLHGALDQRHRLVHVERLGQVIERPALKGGNGAVQVGERGHDDDRQAGVAFLQLAQQLQAVAAWHADVGHQRGGRFVRQRFQHVG
jgi:hypothetical protein